MESRRTDKNQQKQLLIILASILAVLAMSLVLVLIIMRAPDNLRLEDALLSAEIAVSHSDDRIAVPALLTASRYAISANHWRKILRLAARLMPEEPRGRDYNLIATLAGRAATALPGNQEILAFLSWTRLRSGQIKKALKASKTLQYGEWFSLWSEIQLAAFLDKDNKTLAEYARELASQTDSKFFEQAAKLTGSAELAVDAALAYMSEGNKVQAAKLSTDISTGQFNWYNPHSLQKYGAYGALSRIDYESGKIDTAIQWLESGLIEARQQRTFLWEDIQFLGDLYWMQYRKGGNPASLDKARQLWYETKDFLYPALKNDLPANAWRIWLSLAALEDADGNKRISESILLEALTVFPENSVIKTTWARKHAVDKKDLARQLINTDKADPVLIAAALQLDPEILTPRLYEARIWELFVNIVSDKNLTNTISLTEVRQVAAFVLEYMVSRSRYEFLDVALDRYRQQFPNDSWILGWQLSADAARGMAIIDLIRPDIQNESPYMEFRRYATEEGGSLALYDSALFAYLTARELEQIVKTTSSASGSADMNFLEPILLNTAISGMEMKSTLADRISVLEKNRTDLDKPRKLLKKSKSDLQRASARAALLFEQNTLLDNALADINTALEYTGLGQGEKINLYLLRTDILRALGLEHEADKAWAMAMTLKSGKDNSW